MKKSILKFLAIMLIGLVTISACKKDEDPIIIPPDDSDGDKIELANGYYVYSGDITKLADIPANGLMMVTNNEKGQEERASLMETFYMLDATKGFYIIEVSNGSVDYIGSSDVAKVDAISEEPVNGLYKGTTTGDSVSYSVEASGAYHIVIDTDLDLVTYAASDWGIIGSASPNGWNGNTAFPYKESDATKIVWEITEMEMKTGGYKLRYSDGWKIFMDETVDAEVNVNTNLGGTLDALTPGGADMNWEEAGIFTVTLTYTLGTGFTSEVTKTGSVGVTDWSAVAFDVFGNSVSATNATAIDDASNWAWGKAVAADNSGLPTVDGDVSSGAKYTYKWTNVTLDNVDGEGFAIRSVVGDVYNGTVLRYAPIDSLRADLTACIPTTNGFGDVNINVASDANYDVYLTIDAGNKDAMAFSVVQTGTYWGDVWTIIGSATAAGWVDTRGVANADGTEWTFTEDLVEGEFKFRKNGEWAEQIGIKDGIVYFDGNADTFKIADGEDGNYTIVLDSATPDATITKN